MNGGSHRSIFFANLVVSMTLLKLRTNTDLRESRADRSRHAPQSPGSYGLAVAVDVVLGYLAPYWIMHVQGP